MNSILLQVLFVLSISAPFVILSPPTNDLNGPTDCLKCHNIDNDKINVHLVPHSHDDVGWLKTVDQYYYGLKNNIQRASVQYIITSVVDALSQNSDRRFIQVETAFFWKWWQDQSETMRKQFKELVDNGQIEMVNGAWSMNDEACTNYQSTIDQFTWGLRILQDTVGSCGTPKIGWQIDPFGHSREQASIFSQLGYDAVFFARLDHADRSERQSKKSLDFAWQASSNIPNQTIFGGIFPTSIYYPPDGFCWDISCNDDSIVDDPTSADYNLDKKVTLFTQLMKEYSKYLTTNNILIPMGGDFHYSAAEANFINMDRLIKAFKHNKHLNVFYSTPSCYIKAVHDQKPTLTLKVDDFFPYTEKNHSYWTGYFTSRPTTKRFERTGHNILQASKQLVSLNAINGGMKHTENLNNLREVMGTFQHHDAITGTEKQQVAYDYVKQLTNAITEAEQQIGEIIRKLSPDLNVTLDLASCLLSNISICTSQDKEKFVVIVYNPLSWPVTHYVRLPVENTQVTVQGPDGTEKCDAVPTFSVISYLNLPNKPSSKEIVFAAKNVPAFGYKMYFVTRNTDNTTNCNPVTPVKTFTFGTKKTNFVVDESTNLLKSATVNGQTVELSQNFFYYTSVGSGAYLFAPIEETPNIFSSIINATGFTGDVVDEFHQNWITDDAEIKQCIRVYKDEGYIEFDWIVGNIQMSSYGKEVVTKFSITQDFDNKNIFYTDSNGREMIKRTLNERSDFPHDPTEEPVSGNYYPVTSRIVLQDLQKNLEVAVLNDRSQGGTSLNQGEIELMVHRRLIRDDNKGVAENLDEVEFGYGLFVRGSHYLVFGAANETITAELSTSAKARKLAQEKLLQPWVGIAPTNLSYKELEKTIKTPFQPLDEVQVPNGVNILTLEPWREGSYLLRLEYFLEKEEGNKQSEPKQLDLRRLFKEMAITDLQEMTLGGNQKLADLVKKGKYNWTTSGIPMDVAEVTKDQSKYEISLSPMQIRTFIVKLIKGPVSFGVTVKPIFSLVLSLFMVMLFK